MDAIVPKAHRSLSADRIVEIFRCRFLEVPDSRREASVTYPMSDVLMAAFAMFSLKEQSLLAFEDRREDESLGSVFEIKKLPSDSQMREILDGIDYEPLNQCFVDVFQELQRCGALRAFLLPNNHYAVAIDGTGVFSSTEVHCKHCLERHSSSGQTHYYHQAVAAVLVHPERPEVIPLAIEPIIKQDGDNKNDCERNATRRLLTRIRAQHPKLPFVIVEDGLSSNGPHIDDLRALNFRFLLGAKPTDHKHLFEEFIAAEDRNEVINVTTKRPKGDGWAETQFASDLPLNASRADVRVNFVQHFEFAQDSSVEQRFSWVSDLSAKELSPVDQVKAGRRRWGIENETFNTTKNLGYNLEHNYGHGKENLCTVFLLLMFLAFLMDQVQQLCCPLFQAVRKEFTSLGRVWDHLRSHFRHFVFPSFEQLWATILTGVGRNRPPPSLDGIG